MERQERQYGLWDSPISLDLLCQDAATFDASVYSDATGSVYLAEKDSHDRVSIIELNRGAARDILPAQHSVGTAVHGYGGGALALDSARQLIIFSDSRDHGVYSLRPDTASTTPIVRDATARFADFDCSSSGAVVAIREQQRSADTKNELVLIDVAHGTAVTLVEGADFYSQPRFSPCGRKLCWLQWNHPHMPWTGSQLMLADFDDSAGAVRNTAHIAGSGSGQSISQPRWNPADGSLYFADDVSGFWQLYKHGDAGPRPVVTGLEHTDHAGAEFRLGSRTYLPLSPTLLLLTYVSHATSYFALVDLPTGNFTPLPLPVVDASYSALTPVSPTSFLIQGASPSSPPSLYRVDLSSALPQLTLLRRGFSLPIGEEHLSVPRAISAPSIPSLPSSPPVHGFFYPPTNIHFRGPPSSLPPLLVSAHGGPTNHTSPALDLQVQYWTSRGYAVLVLNYAGSTGHGKLYRDALNGAWGRRDSADAAAAASRLVRDGLADGSRVGVVGPSAGGYVALKTICDFPDAWAASVSLFGISDTERFDASTHKFESHYGEGLIFGEGWEGDAGRRREVHVERSPVFHVGKVRAPLLMLQGAKDTIVVPEQTEAMRVALAGEGKVVEVEIFEDQGHSYWHGEALRRSMRAQERWWRKYLLRVEVG